MHRFDLQNLRLSTGLEKKMSCCFNRGLKGYYLPPCFFSCPFPHTFSPGHIPYIISFWYILVTVGKFLTRSLPSKPQQGNMLIKTLKFNYKLKFLQLLLKKQ